MQTWCSSSHSLGVDLTLTPLVVRAYLVPAKQVLVYVWGEVWSLAGSPSVTLHCYHVSLGKSSFLF